MSRFHHLETRGEEPPDETPDEQARGGDQKAESRRSAAEDSNEESSRGEGKLTTDPEFKKRRSSAALLEIDDIAAKDPKKKTFLGGFKRGESGSGERPPAPEEDAPGALQAAEESFYRGDYDRALREYSRVIQLDPTIVRAWVGQVFALLRKKQDGEAMTWVNRALDRFPDEPSLLSTRGLVQAYKGMAQRGIGSSDYALSMGSTRDAWLARGEILLTAGNRHAIDCFVKALEFDPDGPKTLAHIGLTLLDHKKYAAAYEYLTQATEKNPKNDWLWTRLGHCAERLRYYQNAREAYDRALELNPQQRTARRSLERLMTSGPIARFFQRLRE
jgi:tetratricopeptide (TPR) repeat protein